MWSKRLNDVKTHTSHQPIKNFLSRAVDFKHQAEYEEWLKDKYKVGQLLTYRGHAALNTAPYPSILVVLEIQEDYPSLEYDYTSREPKYAKIVNIYRNASTKYLPEPRWDDLKYNRPLTEEETEWVMNDVELSSYIKYQTEKHRAASKQG